MKKKELFICLCLLLIGFVVWFFPKPVEPVLFLGFSNPISIEPKDSTEPKVRDLAQEPKELKEQTGHRQVASP